MGTNWFWRDEICTGCGRFRETHVGKSSAGWSFLFRAWPHQLMDEAHPAWGYRQESPFGFPVASRADWRRVFAETTGELWDEYRRQAEQHPVAWLDEKTPPDARQRDWEDDQMRGGKWFRGLDPRDAEGFRFYAEEFS